MMKIFKLSHLLVILSLGGCKGVPSEYKGTFVDQSQGATLTVKGTEWIFQSKRHSLKGSVGEANFEKIQKGKPGIFVRPYPGRADLVEIFWLNPRVGSLREGGGLSWMETEVAYAVLDAQVEEKVQSFDMVFSDRGQITLEASSKEWQVGWAAGAEDYHFERAPKESRMNVLPTLVTLP